MIYVIYVPTIQDATGALAKSVEHFGNNSECYSIGYQYYIYTVPHLSSAMIRYGYGSHLLFIQLTAGFVVLYSRLEPSPIWHGIYFARLELELHSVISIGVVSAGNHGAIVCCRFK